MRKPPIHGTSKTGVDDLLPVEFMYFVFTRMPGESYRRGLKVFVVVVVVVVV